MKKSKSSGRWLERQSKDVYTQKAKTEGFRSRAVYKLLEIQEKTKIIKPGMIVLDFGAAPGGWSQLVTKIVGPKGKVIALDILPIEPISGVDIIQGDLTDDSVQQIVLDIMENQGADLVISDIAPNLTGVNSIDQPRALYLQELCVDLARDFLKYKGDILLKVFQGEGFEQFVAELKDGFAKVTTYKPKASRLESREVYLLARGYNVNAKTKKV